MKRLSMICITALVSANTAPAFAQHVTPAETPFVAASDPSDPIFFEKPTLGAGQYCNFVLPGETGDDVGGSHSNHAADGDLGTGYNTGGDPLCTSLTTDATVVSPGFTMDSSVLGLGHIARIVVRSTSLPGQTLCDGPLDFTVSSGGVITFNGVIPAGTIPGDCTVIGTLYTSPAINPVS